MTSRVLSKNERNYLTKMIDIEKRVFMAIIIFMIPVAIGSIFGALYALFAKANFFIAGAFLFSGFCSFLLVGYLRMLTKGGKDILTFGTMVKTHKGAYSVKSGSKGRSTYFIGLKQVMFPSHWHTFLVESQEYDVEIIGNANHPYFLLTIDSVKSIDEDVENGLLKMKSLWAPIISLPLLTLYSMYVFLPLLDSEIRSNSTVLLIFLPGIILLLFKAVTDIRFNKKLIRSLLKSSKSQ